MNVQAGLLLLFFLQHFGSVKPLSLNVSQSLGGERVCGAISVGFSLHLSSGSSIVAFHMMGSFTT